MPRLSPEERDALLLEYEAREEPLDTLARRYGVSRETINRYRREAGLSGRASLKLEVQPVDMSVHLLPVYPVRLVSRPGKKGRS